MSDAIRPATPADASRIAEIIVFNNRLNYFPIFRDEGFSFGTVQVLPLANRFLNDPELLGQTWVYDDGVVKGLAVVKGTEIDKLYVEPSFQGRGIGAKLLDFAVSRLGARCLWALEKNEGALRFYARHGFMPTGARRPETGTPEYLVELRREDGGDAGRAMRPAQLDTPNHLQ